MEKFQELEPAIVFQYFQKICEIPHGSYYEKALSNFCVEFAKEHGLEYDQDDLYNVIIKKPASSGYENAPSVIIQGHLDMVLEQLGNQYDLVNEPIQISIDGDYIKADHTTLGADDGVAVAYALAVLASNDILHPAIEAVFTVQEEVGLIGAAELDMSKLNSQYMINIDHGNEKESIISCAGGLKGEISIPISYTEEITGIHKVIHINGLKSGHSGTQIHIPHGNANIILGRILYYLRCELEIGIISLHGGKKDNVICKEAVAEILINPEDNDLFEEIIQDIVCRLQEEYKTVEPNLMIQVFPKDGTNKKIFNMYTSEKIIFLLMNVPNGVQTMNGYMEGLVESSLNLGVLETIDDKVSLSFSIRSDIESKKIYISEKLNYLAQFLGGTYTISSNYPGWEYMPNSKLRELCKKVYRELFHEELTCTAIHAGLECGLFAEAIENIDIISIGPNMYDIHTPQEKLSISSVAKTWNYLLTILKEFKNLS